MKRAAGRSPRSRVKPSSDREQVVRRLQAIRRLARALRREATAPAVERATQIIETECHLALWALGEVRGMTPEVEPGA
jgi:hypothetical protein